MISLTLILIFLHTLVMSVAIRVITRQQMVRDIVLRVGLDIKIAELILILYLLCEIVTDETSCIFDVEFIDVGGFILEIFFLVHS